MSEEAKEQVSALIDGEVSGAQQAQLVDKLLSEPQLIKAWERYNLISDVLRNNICEAALGPLPSVRSNATQSTRQGGDNYPDQRLGRREGLSPSYVAKQVNASLPQEPLRLRRRGPMPLKPMVGWALALAASVAIVAVLGVQRFTQDPLTNDDSSTLRVAAPAQTSPSQTALSQDNLPTAASNGGHERVVNARLASYLVNYSEYLDNGMRGLLPYARIVSHDANNP
ncbi:MAG: sigma-E factor negative regulatory protein [Gammaproteobacteria bacterium]